MKMLKCLNRSYQSNSSRYCCKTEDIQQHFGNRGINGLTQRLDMIVRRQEGVLLIERIHEMIRKEEKVYYRPISHYSRNGVHSSDCVDDSTSLYQHPENYHKFLVYARTEICHWTFRIIDYFDFSRETAAVCMNLYDRYMSVRGSSLTDESTIVLIASAAMSIAVKTNEKKKIKLTTLSELSKGRIKTEDLQVMECDMLSALNWLVHPPTGVCFVYQYMHFFSSQVKPSARHLVYDMSRYILEISTFEVVFANCKPSILSFAAIMNVLDDYIPDKVILTHNRLKFLDEIYLTLNIHSKDKDVVRARFNLRNMLVTNDITLGLDSSNRPPNSCPDIMNDELCYSSDEDDSTDDSMDKVDSSCKENLKISQDQFKPPSQNSLKDKVMYKIRDMVMC